MRSFLALALALTAACELSGSSTSEEASDVPLSTPSDFVEADPSRITATVVHVSDGDSMIVAIDGEEYRVRLIGINAPEQGECMGAEARQSLTDLVADRSVVLEKDAEDEDHFGRLLRYVWLDGTFINEALVADGLVIAKDYEPNLSRKASLDQAQTTAQSAGLGMWAEGACGEATPADISIVAIQANPPGPDEDNLNGEFVIFRNDSSESVDLSGFILRDGSSSNRYELPDGFSPATGDEFVIYVGCGNDSGNELYWCSDTPVWSNSGDEVFLTDPAGNIVAYQQY